MKLKVAFLNNNIYKKITKNKTIMRNLEKPISTLLNPNESEVENSPLLGLTKREYACIKLGVPETDDKDLNELILKSQQNRNSNTASHVPYQLCPKCNGDGNLLRYNSPPNLTTTAAAICDVCNGDKIIPMCKS